MPLYPLGRNPGGDGPNDDPDLSHMGVQIDFGNRLEKTVQITDLEKVENPDYGSTCCMLLCVGPPPFVSEGKNDIIAFFCVRVRMC